MLHGNRCVSYTDNLATEKAGINNLLSAFNLQLKAVFLAIENFTKTSSTDDELENPTILSLSALMYQTIYSCEIGVSAGWVWAEFDLQNKGRKEAE